jgi:hypothetical protein
VAWAAGEDLTTVTGSRRLDALAFVFLACLIVATSYGRLRVYYQVTVWDLTLSRLTPDGTRQVLPTPGQLRRSFLATEAPESAIAGLERAIGAHMRSRELRASDHPGARYEWRIRYSHNNLSLDQQRVLVFEPNAADNR